MSNTGRQLIEATRETVAFLDQLELTDAEESAAMEIVREISKVTFERIEAFVCRGAINKPITFANVVFAIALKSNIATQQATGRNHL